MKIAKIIFMTVFTTIMCGNSYAQTYEWEKPPKTSEKVIEVVTKDVDGGSVFIYNAEYGVKYGTTGFNNEKHYSKEGLYELLFEYVGKKYGNKYPNLAIRDFKFKHENREQRESYGTFFYFTYKCSAKVVVLDPIITIKESFSLALEKSFRNIPEGSRMAIDIVTVASGIGIDKATVKDMVVDVLLDKDYKVVAKEYLEKLYNEQQQQQSGIYNDRTTVQENNFSAVGYYINVKVTETSLRLQVINVSTGEYESNTTVNF